MTTIDVHTHMISDGWMQMFKKHKDKNMGIGRWDSGIEYMLVDGVPELNFVPELIDYKLRIKGMDKGRVDLAIVSLTSPNVYFGTSDVSAEVARLINDDMAAAQRAYPDRIRFFCSLPWQYPDLALAELDRAVKLGAVGVMVLAHIRERQLIDPHFAPIWAEIDRRTLPVLVHPTTPYGATESGIQNVRYLLASLGFTYDTTLAICQLVMTGFLEKYPNLKIIASHGGGYIPYVASRIDMFYRLSLSKPTWKMPALPSDELARIYYDAVVYSEEALDMCISLAGPEHVLFGSDYPCPADFERLHALTDSLPIDQRRAVKGGNAKRIFKL